MCCLHVQRQCSQRTASLWEEVLTILELSVLKDLREETYAEVFSMAVVSQLALLASPPSSSLQLRLSQDSHSWLFRWVPLSCSSCGLINIFCFHKKNATRTWILTTVQPSSSYLLFWWLPKCFDMSVSWERIAGFAMAANALSVRPPLRGPSHFLQSEINSCNIHNGKFVC